MHVDGRHQVEERPRESGDGARIHCVWQVLRCVDSGKFAGVAVCLPSEDLRRIFQASLPHRLPRKLPRKLLRKLPLACGLFSAASCSSSLRGVVGVIGVVNIMMREEE